jgi:ParB family transcriptional regulator, chromosome partitioning protein
MDMRTQVSTDGRHKLHMLKTDPGPFEAILKGEKRFEYRPDDRGFEVGDTLKLVEYDRRAGRLTGRFCFVDVLYIARLRHGIPYGYCAMSVSGPEVVGEEEKT